MQIFEQNVCLDTFRKIQIIKEILGDFWEILLRLKILSSPSPITLAFRLVSRKAFCNFNNGPNLVIRSRHRLLSSVKFYVGLVDINQMAGLQTYFSIFRIFCFLHSIWKLEIDESALPSGMSGLWATKEKVLIQMHVLKVTLSQKLSSLSINTSE